jgi:glucose/arabinose dehydrogenase
MGDDGRMRKRPEPSSITAHPSRRSSPARPRPFRSAALAGVALTLLAGAGCSSTGSQPAAGRGTPSAPATSAPGTAPSGTTAPGGSGNGSSTAATEDLPTPSVVATKFTAPWGIAFLPDGDALVPERDSGRIFQVHAGSEPREVMTVGDVEHAGEAGLLGLAVSPRYAEDGLVYAYFTGPDDNRIVRFKLGGEPQVIVQGIRKAPIHDGGRLAFGPDGKLYATTGDAGDKPLAQDKGSLNGKILRMEPDGSVPADNPFKGSLVYSYGHRNVQGITWDPSGRMWSAEFGQNTWDELNLITAGGNYGWPEVEGKGGTSQGFIDPKVVWATKDASPSGVAYWNGALYVAALQGKCLWQVPIDGDGNTGDPVRQAEGHGRLRTPIVAKDGSLWVSTSNTDGRGQPQPDDDQIFRFAG